MIISALTGGLGNQMFQYATGFAAAKRSRTPYRLDLRHFDYIDPSLPKRPFALNRFKLSAKPMSRLERWWLDFSLLPADARRATRAWKRLGLPKFKVVVDAEAGYDSRLARVAQSIYLVGCWQTDRFFIDCRDEILDEFRWKALPDARNQEIIARMQSTISISVHFRRTDYLLQSTLLKPCGLDYYERAFAAMANEFPNASYFIFTDDASWVRKNARLPPNSEIIDHNTGVDDAQDMRLMSHCDHFIIANSTFSWWGAWLAQSTDKRVIAPAVWYQSGHGSEQQLVPNAWVRL